MSEVIPPAPKAKKPVPISRPAPVQQPAPVPVAQPTIPSAPSAFPSVTSNSTASSSPKAKAPGPRPSPSAVVYENWAIKEGGSHKSWKKRFFRIKGNGYIFYYKNPTQNRNKFLGSICLENAELVENLSLRKYPFAIGIRTPERLYKIALESATTKKAWLRALRLVIYWANIDYS